MLVPMALVPLPAGELQWRSAERPPRPVRGGGGGGGEVGLEEPGDHVDAFRLDVRRLRILLVVDEVLGLGVHEFSLPSRGRGTDRGWGFRTNASDMSFSASSSMLCAV